MDEPAATGARTISGTALGALLLICCGQFMLVLDVTIVNVALPAMQRHLQLSQAGLQWVVTGYALTFGGFLMLGGRAADMFGRRRMFMTGLVLFALTSLVAGLAQSGAMLIGARLAQGLGGAIVSPAALSLLTTTFHEGAARNRAVGIWAGVAAGGGAVGVFLGGVLTQLASWHWVFLVNVPVAAIVVALAPRFLRESQRALPHRPDVAGALLGTGGLILLVLGLTEGEQNGFASASAWGTLVLAVLLLVTFVVVERIVADPLVPFRIFRGRTVLGADIGILLMSSVAGALWFHGTLYLQDVLHLSPIATGLGWVPVTLCLAVTAQVASRSVARVGPKLLFAGGLVLLACGLALLSRVPADGTYVVNALPGMALAALGIGLAFTTATVAATSGVADGDQGFASGLLVTSQQMGSAIGLAVLALIAASHARASSAGADEALASGFRLAYLVSACMALAAAAIVLVLVQDADCIAELRRRRLRALVHQQVPQPVSGQLSGCWPAVADLHDNAGPLAAEPAAARA